MCVSLYLGEKKGRIIESQNMRNVFRKNLHVSEK